MWEFHYSSNLEQIYSVTLLFKKLCKKFSLCFKYGEQEQIIICIYNGRHDFLRFGSSDVMSQDQSVNQSISKATSLLSLV